MNTFLGILGGEQTQMQKISLYVAIFLFVFVLFMCAMMPSKKKTASKFSRTKLKEILRSCLQLLEDSKQDSNSVIRLAHANYAQAYLNVARMLQTDEDIVETTGKEIEALQADLDEAQKDAMRSVSKQASTQVKY
jgi:CII-binding regulator of phage lambda lysogenization HflD